MPPRKILISSGSLGFTQKLLRCHLSEVGDFVLRKERAGGKKVRVVRVPVRLLFPKKTHQRFPTWTFNSPIFCLISVPVADCPLRVNVEPLDEDFRFLLIVRLFSLGPLSSISI